MIILFSTFNLYPQLTAKHGKNAWQRTAYEDWDDFRPWWYFNIVNAKYKKEDRRTMYARMGQMTLWSVYADVYDMHNRSVDSVLSQETYKALDKSLNKNYLVLQKGRVSGLYDIIESLINQAIEDGLPPELYNIIADEYTNISNDIDFLRSSYAPDAEKYPLIELQIKKLEDLVQISNLIVALASVWEDLNNNLIEPDYTAPIEDTRIKLENLLIPNE